MARAFSKQGFTLIELLIAVLIIGILAAIALPALNKQRERAKDSAAQQGLEAGLRAAKAVYAEGESFPASGLGTLLGRAERSQSFADGTTFPAASANTINVERVSAQRVLLRTTSASGNQHMLALDEPNSSVNRYGPEADASSPSIPVYSNLIVNPSLEAGLGTWYGSSGTGGSPTAARVADGYVGDYSVEMYDPNVGSYGSLYGFMSNYRAIAPGQIVSVAAAVKMVSTSAAPGLILQVRFNNLGSYAAETQVAVVNNPVPGRWYRLVGEMVAPSGVDSANLGIKTSGNIAGANVRYRIDAAQMAFSTPNGARRYVDGDQPGASWSATAHNSASSGPGLSSSWP